jgi:hypothetical protein
MCDGGHLYHPGEPEAVNKPGGLSAGQEAATAKGRERGQRNGEEEAAREQRCEKTPGYYTNPRRGQFRRAKKVPRPQGRPGAELPAEPRPPGDECPDTS